jgi:hypothetical protein
MDQNALAAKRYTRFMNGEALEKIAETDGVSLEKVRRDISKRKKLNENRLRRQVIEHRIEGQLENEKLRKKARARLSGKFLDSLDKLLEGKRIIISRDKKTGEVTIEEVVDPEVMATGIELYMKTASLEEKPAPAPTVVNVQQNQNNNNPQFAGDMSFESILSRIREKQKAVGPVIETKALNAAPESPEGIIEELKQIDKIIAEADEPAPAPEQETKKEEVSQWEF